jgi:integrase
MSAAAYTIAEYADLQKVSPATVRAWVASGKLDANRLTNNGPWRIPASEVDRTTEADGMGARYDTERKQWFADFWHHYPSGRRERFRIDSPVNTRQGALSYERQVRKEIEAGTYRRQQPTTLRDIWQDFSAWAHLELKPSTADRYDMMARLHLLPFWGRTCLAAIDARSIVEYKAAKVAAGLSRKTVNNHLALLSSVMARAVEWGRLDRSPKIELFTLAPVEFDWLTRDDADRIIAHATGYWRSMIVVALNTGMRMGELEALRWDDVDLKRGVLRVCRSWWSGSTFTTPKSGKVREIPLNDVAVSALQDHPRMVGCELVWHTASGGVIDKPDLYKGLSRICSRACVRAVGWHVFRHTFASWLVQRGVPLKSVQELLGHSTIAMTERYSHLSPDVRREAVQALVRGQQLGNGQEAKSGDR